jgi:MFS family permease
MLTPSGQISATPDDRYRCGTLTYTKAGLFTLFSWLLWGDFCFTLMEVIWPTILPLVIKGQGAPNTVLSLVMTTIPSAMNFILNPIISTASDRHRGRRGRRIPFLLWATPFISLFLVLLGFSRELGEFVHAAISGTFPALTPSMVSIGLICVLVIGFRFFELFVATVFWYLFNDVVPSAFMGRFLGLFRVVGSLAGALFSYFLLPYAETHYSFIFLGAAILYGSAFIMMSLNVKEGEYPPPDQNKEARPSLVVLIKSFFTECFTHRIFQYIFTASFFGGMTVAINTFVIFQAFSVGLTLKQVGQISAVATLVSMLLMYPVGALVDRFRPLRIMLVAQLGFCLVIPIKLVFLFRDFSPETTFLIFACTAGIYIPFSVANTASSVPMLMLLFPQEKYGQFCSANAMCHSMGLIVGGMLAGLVLDGLKSATGGGDYYYRFIPLWSTCFMGVVMALTYMIFRQWKKLGGDSSYRSPIADRFASASV